MLPRDILLTVRKIRALQLLMASEDCTAADLVFCLLSLWQQRCFPTLPRQNLIPSRLVSANPSISEFAAHLSQLDFFDAAFWLSSAYAIWVGDRLRTERAMFFTPPALALRVIDDLLASGASLTESRWLDPACGGAAFLAPVASRMREALAQNGKSATERLVHIANHLAGSDIDPTLCELSRQFLRMALAQDIAETGIEPAWSVTQLNALTDLTTWFSTVDVIVCNPPYRKLRTSELDIYREAYVSVIEGQFNLYGLFIKLTTDLLKPDGRAGLLTPTSYLSGQTFSKLRTYLLKHAEVEHLGIIAKHLGVFMGVEQETTVTVLKRRQAGRDLTKTTNILVYDRTRAFIEVGACSLPNSGSSWPVPRSPSDLNIITTMNKSRYRLDDYGYTARIGAYVDYRDKYELSTYTQSRGRCIKRELRMLVWSSDIGTDKSLQINRLAAKDHKCFIDIAKRPGTSVITRPAVAMQRVTSPEQPKRLVAAAVPRALLEHGVVGENHVIFLEQRKKKAALTPSQLASVLASIPVDRYFRCISGAVNVSIFELEQLPLPNPEVLAGLLRKGMPVDEAVNKAFMKQVRPDEAKKNA